MAVLILAMALICPPLGICAFYGIANDFRRWKIYVFCLALTMAAVAYSYIPSGNVDLVRYFEYINSLKSSSFIDTITQHVYRDKNTLWLFTVVCWFSGKCNDPHMVPAISTFFVYYIGLYVTCRIGSDLNNSKSSIIMHLIFIMMALDFCSIINNVRNVASFCIIGFAIFRDVYEGKRNIGTFALYILPIFLHESAILIIMVRIVLPFIRRFKKIAAAASLLLIPVIYFLYELIIDYSSGNMLTMLFKNFVNRAYLYFSDTSSEWGMITHTVLIHRLERYIDVLMVALICILAYYVSKKGLKNQEITKIEDQNNRIKHIINFDIFVYAACLLTFVTAQVYMPIYWRFFAIVIVFSGIVFLFLKSKPVSQMVLLIETGVYACAPMCMILWVRFIIESDLHRLIVGPFFSSPIAVAAIDVLTFLGIEL